MEENELQEKVLVYRLLEARLNSLLKERELMLSKIIEIQTTLQSIEEIKKGEEVLFALGSEAYAFGRLKEKDKIIVEIGSNIALEKTFEDAKKTLEKRRVEMEKALNEVEKSIVEISSRLQELAPEIEKLAKGS
ncbi:MAG: prefoldin subunit alpha [Candidatus Aenigmatarchaeota archaeon]